MAKVFEDLSDPEMVLMVDFSTAEKEVYNRLRNAENELIEFVTGQEVRPAESRRRLLALRREPDPGKLGELLARVEQCKASFWAALQMLSLSHASLRNVGTRSTTPPQAVTSTGLVDLTSDCCGEVLAQMFEPQARKVTYFEKDAYRARRCTIDELVRIWGQQAHDKRLAADRSETNAQYDRRRRQEEAMAGFLSACAKLRKLGGLMKQYNVDDVHLRVRSGTGTRYNARFDGPQGVQFTFPHLALVALDPACQGVEQSQIHRPKHPTYYRVGMIGSAGVFLHESEIAQEIVDAMAEFMDETAPLPQVVSIV